MDKNFRTLFECEAGEVGYALRVHPSAPQKIFLHRRNWEGMLLMAATFTSESGVEEFLGFMQAMRHTPTAWTYVAEAGKPERSEHYAPEYYLAAWSQGLLGEEEFGVDKCYVGPDGCWYDDQGSLMLEHARMVYAYMPWPEVPPVEPGKDYHGV